MARAWYVYIGSGSTDDVDNYLPTIFTPTCFSGHHLCAVYATVNPSYPSKPLTISLLLRYYIANGIVSGGPQPFIPPKTKPYVYFLPY